MTILDYYSEIVNKTANSEMVWAFLVYSAGIPARAKSEDTAQRNFGNLLLDTSLIPVVLGGRYLFPIDNSFWSRFHPYVASGGGVYFLKRKVLWDDGRSIDGVATDTLAGLYAGVGNSLQIYGDAFRLGVDLRFHKVFTKNEDTPAGSTFRGGTYLSASLDLEYLL